MSSPAEAVLLLLRGKLVTVQLCIRTCSAA